MKNEICKIEMFYEFIEFKNTIIKSYYQISIEINENTTVVSNDEQMFSDENEFSNDEKIIDQSLELHDTKTNAITLNAIIFDMDALNATALSAFNRAKSEKTLQSSSIKRDRDHFRKQSIIQLKNQFNLSIFLLNKIDSSILSFRTLYAKSKKKKINDLLNKRIFDVIILINVFTEIRLFNFCFVDEIKNSSISATFEKSRLMIQAFNDQKKNDYDSVIHDSTYESTFDTDFNCNHRSRIIFSKHFSNIRSINYFVD